MGTRFLLSPDAYFGDVWFAREQQKLFAHSWHLAAATDELAEPGDFVTIDAGFDPLVVVRNSLGAALSMTGLQVGLMFAGVVVIESIFAWPGIGFYTVQAIPRLDFPAIAGVTLFLGAMYVIINTGVEVLQGVADPRLRV